MDSNKILISDYAGLTEKRLYYRNYELTSFISQASVLVNPIWGILMGKIIIINLPVDLPIVDLMEHNTVISRFPISPLIPVIPYKLPESRKKLAAEDYCPKILMTELMKELDFTEEVDNNDYLLAVTPTVEDHLTCVGHKLLSTQIEDLE